MANKTITELQLISSVDDGLNIPGDDGIQSYRATASQFYDYIKSKFLGATGDMIYSSSGTTPAKLAIGSPSQIIQPVSGVPAWTWPMTPYTSQNTTYGISATADKVVDLDATSGTFTATLPTAASVTGKIYVLTKIDSTLNSITIATTSSQTINGIVGTVINTQGETLVVRSNGSNWQILYKYIPSIRTAYTPTMTSFGTASSVTGFWWRDGDEVVIEQRFTSGTPTGVEARGSLPSGITSAGAGRIDFIQPCGIVASTGFASTFFQFIPLIEQGVGYLTFGGQTSTNGGLNKQLGNVLASNGQVFYVKARVPVAGWLL